MMEIIFVEFNPINHCEETYAWINDLYIQYSQEVKDREGKIKIVSERWNTYGNGFEYLMLEIIEEDASSKFKEQEGRQRKTRIPVFDKKDLTKVVAYQSVMLDIKIYPEAPDDFEFKPREVSRKCFRLSFPDIGMGEEVVEVIHKPTNIKVQCKEEQTKQDNEAMALRILKAKLYKE